MGDAISGYGREDRFWFNRPQTNMGTHCCGNCPGKGPSVTVKHRQGPQVNRVTVKFHGRHVAQRIQVSAAVVVDATLGVASRSRRIQQRQRLPLVLGLSEGKVSSAPEINVS